MRRIFKNANAPWNTAARLPTDQHSSQFLAKQQRVATRPYTTFQIPVGVDK
jgi:hypothetical protein